MNDLNRSANRDDSTHGRVEIELRTRSPFGVRCTAAFFVIGLVALIYAVGAGMELDAGSAAPPRPAVFGSALGAAAAAALGTWAWRSSSGRLRIMSRGATRRVDIDAGNFQLSVPLPASVKCFWKLKYVRGVPVVEESLVLFDDAGPILVLRSGSSGRLAREPRGPSWSNTRTRVPRGCPKFIVGGTRRQLAAFVRPRETFAMALERRLTR